MNRAALYLIMSVVLFIAPSAGWCSSKPANAAMHNDPAVAGLGVQFDFSQLASRLARAVVAIRAEAEIVKPAGRRSGLSEASDDRVGSGFIIDPAGYVLTSAHVIIGAQRIVVTLADERICPARLAGADFLVDVAVLKIGCDHLPVLALGDASRVDLGEPVMAIGNPYGLSGTVSVGIVSATQRYVPGRLAGFIQTDAVLNPGSSGGPLIDGHGRVIGISTALFTLNGATTGIGFAVPIDAVRHEIPLLETAGRVAHGWIGARLHPIAADLALAMGLKSSSGALVTDVTKGSPAAAAGLRQGDILVAFDGQPVDAAQELALFIKDASVGSRARLTVRRRGSLIEVNVQIRRDLDGARWLADVNDFPI